MSEDMTENSAVTSHNNTVCCDPNRWLVVLLSRSACQHLNLTLSVATAECERRPLPPVCLQYEEEITLIHLSYSQSEQRFLRRIFPTLSMKGRYLNPMR